MIDVNTFQNKTAAYYTLGCKLNFAETSTIGKTLEAHGIRKARPGEKADICVINTCSVTELADKKCRQTIRRIARQHPQAFIVVTGCYAQLKPDEIAHIPDVDLILGAEQKLDILQYLGDLHKRQEVGEGRLRLLLHLLHHTLCPGPEPQRHHRTAHRPGPRSGRGRG